MHLVQCLAHRSTSLFLVGKTLDESLSEPGAQGRLLYKRAWSLSQAQEMTL